jgi:hypothetical protein
MTGRILKERETDQPVIWMSSELNPDIFRQRFEAAVVAVDFAEIEARVLVRSIVDHAKAEIAKRAGCKGGRVEILFSTFDDYPPTLQRVGKGGKILKQRRNERARGSRRIVVGRHWLQKNTPELWAAFVAARLHAVPIPSSLPRNTR